MTKSNTIGQTIRLGKIGYLNVLPIYEPLESQRVRNDFSIVAGPPAKLNQLMAASALDISAMSSIEYARRPEAYSLVPNLAIGSRGPVMSVLLLSRKPAQELDAKPILVSSQTHTSAALLRLLAQNHWNIEPHYDVGDPTTLVHQTATNRRDAPQACLAIGDQALALRNHPAFDHCIDLGEAWRNWTGMPFIFGVWGVRKDRTENTSQPISHAVSQLLRAKEKGTEDMDRTLDLAMDYIARSQTAPDTPAITLTRNDMRTYFEGLVYDLGLEEQQGLLRFFKELTKAGEIPEVPELSFFC